MASNKKIIEKLIVQPNGQYGFLDITNGQRIPSERPSVVINSEFIFEKVHIDKQLTILKSGLPEEASDEDFKTYLDESKGDIELAIESFASLFTTTE